MILAPPNVTHFHVFDYYSLMWVLGVAVLLVTLASIASVVIWNIEDSRGYKPPWIRELKINRKDIAGYELTGKNSFEQVTLTWLDDLPALGKCRLDVKRYEGGRVKFRSGLLKFDMHFAVREASPETIANIWANGHRLEPAVLFLERRLGKIDNITIEGRATRFRGKYGGIPGKYLPEMVQFANAFYSAAAFPPLVPEPPELRQKADYRSPPAMAGKTWLVENVYGEPLGPIPSDRLVRWLYAGVVTPTTRIALADTKKWKPLGKVSGLREFFGKAPPAPKKATSTASGARQTVFWLLRKPYGDIVLAVASLLATVGAFWLASGKQTWDLAIESVAWPSVEGQVTVSREKCTSSGSGSNRRTSCSHDLRYRYKVHGKQFEAYRMRFGAHGESIETRVKQYPKGKKVSVYYHSLDPSVAVLQTGTEHLEPLVFAYIPLLLGLGVTLPLGTWRLSVLLGRLRRWWARRRLRRAIGL